MSSAIPPSSTTVDHDQAEIVPIEISVSIVATAWRAFSAAARWNGQPLQNTTGVASASDTHSQPENCAAGTIASTASGADSTAATSSRSRYGRVGSSSPSASRASEAW